MRESLFPVLFGDPFAVMNTIGLTAFAFVGASKAIREEFDVLGIIIVGLAMAFAGGATHDILVMRVPSVLQSPVKISLGLVGIGLAIVLSIGLTAPETHLTTLIADAIGLAAFATTGAIVATEVGVSAFGIIAVAMINAVGGGAFADILLDRSPFILSEDFYASCAVLGGTAYWIAGALALGESTAAGACAVVTVVTRVTAVTCGWQLPTVQALRQFEW